MVKQFKDKFLKKPYIINLMEELTLKGLTQVRAAIIVSKTSSNASCQFFEADMPMTSLVHRGCT